MIVLYTSLIFSCVWIGVILSKKLHSREMFYENMLSFLRMYKLNLSFAKKGFSEIIEEFLISGVSLEFSEFLTAKLKSENYKVEFLSDRETKELEEIIFSLGKQDEETEKQMVEDSVIRVASKLETASKKNQKYSGLSIKVSLLVGVLLVILLI